MYSSASSSSSAVVTPARTFSPIRARRRGDDLAGAGHRLDLGLGLADDHSLASSTDLISANTSSTEPSACSADHVAACGAVVLDERGGLAVVDLEALADRVGRVVAAAFLDRAPGDPLDQNLAVGDLKLEDDVEVTAETVKQLVERLRLGDVPREAVEDEPRDRVAAIEARLDQLDDRGVVDELAPVVDLLDAQPERRVQLLDLADHVAGRDLRDPVRLRDELGLGPLPDP